MKLSRVWPAVRQTMVTAVICVATSSGVAHRVTSQTVDFEFLKLAPFKPNATRLVQPDDQKKPDAAHPQEARRAEMKSFYARWVGVRAAELGQAARDHDGKLVTLSSFRGKRVLLFSFDAGNFNREPDETAVLTNLRARQGEENGRSRQSCGRGLHPGNRRGSDGRWNEGVDHLAKLA